ncbi:MAG: cofactor-independent phosphoglycerate mutase [Candidatus Aenigmarchaeota archaeon]|nr:cofactor-independent phosphoglycerate mutase [Candidatus Aenigmarchaeota archaeon]
MKYIIILGDGMGGYPLKEHFNKTTLELAETPNMDYIARCGSSGLAKTVPDNLPPGSDVANLSILSYDPAKYYTGRGPLEAASIGIDLEKEDIAFRCNLITEKDGLLVDYSSGHISNEEAEILIKEIKDKLETDTVKFYPGISYRHLMVLKKGNVDGLETIPPHDVIGTPIEEVLPSGENQIKEILVKLINESRYFLNKHPINQKRIKEGKNPANLIWPWSPGKKPEIQTLEEKYNIKGSLISAVDLIKGIGICAGLSVIDVPGATGLYDTNYEGKADYALKALQDGSDFVFIHVEAPDEAGHSRDAALKIKCIEDLDKRLIGRILNNFDGNVMIVCDHFTPIDIGTHVRDRVPFSIMGPAIKKDECNQYNEKSCSEGEYGKVNAVNLMDILLNM